MVYLRTKDRTEYNGWEKYVADRIAARDASFIPTHKAIALKEFKEREERDALLMTDRQGAPSSLCLGFPC